MGNPLKLSRETIKDDFGVGHACSDHYFAFPDADPKLDDSEILSANSILACFLKDGFVCLVPLIHQSLEGLLLLRN